MIELFDKYIKWKILAHFLAHPNTFFHIKEIARILEVSPGSVSTAVKFFEEWGLLVKEERGLAHLYKLSLEHRLTPPLKKAYGLAFVLSSRLAERLLEVDENIISVALFGSYADGSFDEKSDVDLLIISPTRKEETFEMIKRLEDDMRKNVGTSFFKLSDWRLMAKKEDAFYKRVVENHVLLYGSELK